MKPRSFIIVCIFFPALTIVSCHAQKSSGSDPQPVEFMNGDGETITRITMTGEAWKNALSAEAYYVLRQEGTERAFTGEYWDHHDDGTYLCAACGLELFSSKAKFDSGTGWPSFYTPIDGAHVGEDRDVILGFAHTEVHCNRCGGHLGHVFSDGPKPTGLRYCINSVSLDFNVADSEGQK
jgi:peptide-methionine (R)-S-oxide reductase